MKERMREWICERENKGMDLCKREQGNGLVKERTRNGLVTERTRNGLVKENKEWICERDKSVRVENGRVRKYKRERLWKRERERE